MKNKLSLLVLLVTLTWTATPLMAQSKRVSPHETISTVVDGGRVIIVYGRPYSKNPKTGEERKIWGGLVPYDKIWRTGADEATLLVTQKTLQIGTTTLTPGTYSLFTLPEENGPSKLVINKDIGMWGTQYNEASDIARVN